MYFMILNLTRYDLGSENRQGRSRHISKFLHQTLLSGTKRIGALFNTDAHSKRSNRSMVPQAHHDRIRFGLS